MKFYELKGFEKDYKINELGDVLCTKKNKILKKSYVKNGYEVVNINNKIKYTHKLMAIQFLNHKPCGMDEVVDHINNIQTDNRLQNLQLLTQRENSVKNNPKFQGCYYHNRDKAYRVQPRYKGKPLYCGNFKDKEKAILTYKYFDEITKDTTQTREQIKGLIKSYKKTL